MSTLFSFLTFFCVALSDTGSYADVPPDRQSLLNAEGMGMASYAEMNSYPGPKHVIELKDQLGLSADQLKKTEGLMKGVELSGKLTGQEIVHDEEELYKLFEGGKANDRTVRARVERIGKLRGELRFIHLQAHVKMKQILSVNQIQRYNELRGHGSH